MTVGEAEPSSLGSADLSRTVGELGDRSFGATMTGDSAADAARGDDSNYHGTYDWPHASDLNYGVCGLNHGAMDHGSCADHVRAKDYHHASRSSTHHVAATPPGTARVSHDGDLQTRAAGQWS